MENWIIRIAAALCAAGSSALFWALGAFIAVPWREGRLLALNAVELQLIGAPLLLGLAVAWGALHILAIADRDLHPRLYSAACALLLIASLGAASAGLAWAQLRGF
jgi:hypothetical protein